MEVPVGFTTREAIAKAKEELNDAMLEIAVHVRYVRMIKAQQKRIEECKELGIPFDGYSDRQLKTARKYWLRNPRRDLLQAVNGALR